MDFSALHISRQSNCRAYQRLAAVATLKAELKPRRGHFRNMLKPCRKRHASAGRALAFPVMITHRGLLLYSVLCGAGVLWSGGLIVALALGDRPVDKVIAVGVAALLTVPGFAAAILSNRRGYRTQQPRRLWALASWVPPHVPIWAAIAAGLAFFGFWLAIVLAFVTLKGNPEVRADGAYVLDKITVVSRETYERQIDHEQQISLGVLGAFAVGGAFLCAARATDREPV